MMSCDNNSRSDFYRHLTLDVVVYLQSIEGVVDVKLDEKNGCETRALLHWEQLHSVLLPEEIKNFYLASNGFELNWKFRLADYSYPTGKMHINSLTQLCPVTEPWKVCNVNKDSDFEMSKLFVLDSNFSQGCTVLMVNLTNSSVHYLSGQGHFLYKLTDNLATYLRLMMLYLGLPDWPLLHLKMEPSYWNKQLYDHFLPYLATSHTLKSKNGSQQEESNTSDITLDSYIFKTNKTNKR